MTRMDPPARPEDLIRQEVAALPDYNAGLALDRFREIYGLDARAKLDSNENPVGPSPKAVTAIIAGAAGVARYPDAGNARLREAVAGAAGVAPDSVIFGNGSEDLIGVLFRTVLRPGDRVVTICPSFGLHEFAARACGASVAKVHFTPDWRFPVEGLLAAMAEPTRVLILSSPSNPVGPAIPAEELARLLAGTPPGTLVAFDEAYLEYLGPEARIDALALLRASGHRWISLRTFSKAYGLAGLRVGYGIASDPQLVRAMTKARNPFCVNALAGTAALAALEDAEHLETVTDLARRERDRVSRALAERGYACAPTQANFVFFDTGGPAAKLAEALRREGILVKAWAEEPYRSWARVSIGARQENDAFLQAIPERGG